MGPPQPAQAPQLRQRARRRTGAGGPVGAPVGLGSAGVDLADSLGDVED